MPLQNFWSDKRSGAALLYLLIHSTPFGGPFQVIKPIFYLIFLFKMNLVPKMNLIRVKKVNLKNTRVLKENLFVVLGHFIKYFTILLERSDGAEFGPLLFLERSERRN